MIDDELTPEQAKEDIAFLARRASRAGSFTFSAQDRDWGISSNAIVRLAYGGDAPKQMEMPRDLDDVRACCRAVANLPAHRRTADVIVALERARNAVEAK